MPNVENFPSMAEVTKFAKKIGLDTEKLLSDWIVCIPGFTLDKYRQLQRSKLSIFAVNCFGTLISNTLGLPFLSPFVNMNMNAKEFLRFLKHPRVYIEESLIFKEKMYHSGHKYYYPIYILGDVCLNMIHYPKFDEAVEKWEERKKRINWYNLFVTMDTEDPEILEEFNTLPYGKKVCFVPFKSDLDSAFYINHETNQGKAFWAMTHDYARGYPPSYYDMFDMLLYGKKTQLIDM